MFSFLTKEQATKYEALRALIAVDSTVIEDYVPAFEALLASRFLSELVTTSLKEVQGYDLRLDASTEETDWRVVLTDRFSLAVRQIPKFTLGQSTAATRPGPAVAVFRRTLTAIPNDFLLGVMGRGAVTVDLYRSAFDRDEEVFSPAHRIEHVERRRIRPGAWVLTHASREVIDIVEVEDDVVSIEFALTAARTVVWNYDAETLRASFASSGSVEGTRMEFAIELFRRFKDRNALTNLVRIARDHKCHWVRWKAVQAAVQIDPASGREALDVALADAHVHVRNAAQATLDNLRNANLIS
jgi:hypothetical protein